MATISTPVRQPFGVLNQSKLRNLDSIKNRQNAITPYSAPNLKRRAPSPEISDSENIDPSYFELGNKRKRALDNDDVATAKHSKTNNYQLHVTTSTSVTPMTSSMATNTTPLSAPAAAGRSPTRQRSKHDKMAPRKRFVQPSFTGSSPSISISAALRGTLSHKRSSRPVKSAKSLQEERPKSWFFDIYEESQDEQDYTVSEWTMTQSSANLDISDDEGKAKSISEPDLQGRGKENVDPNATFEPTIPITRSMVRSNSETDINAMQAEEVRTPLSNLDAAKFYSEGLNATSVVLVHDDVPEEHGSSAHEQQTTVLERELESKDFTFEAPLEIQDHEQGSQPLIDIPAWAKKQTLELQAVESQSLDGEIPAVAEESLDIEIWESESAKDENEQQEENPSGHIVIGEGQTICLSEVCV